MARRYHVCAPSQSPGFPDVVAPGHTWEVVGSLQEVEDTDRVVAVAVVVEVAGLADIGREWDIAAKAGRTPRTIEYSTEDLHRDICCARARRLASGR